MRRTVACCALLVACGARTQLDGAIDASSHDVVEPSDASVADTSPQVDGGKDASPDVTVGWPRVWGSSGVETSNAVAVGGDGSVVVVGVFEGTVDFDPNGAGDVHTAIGKDVFVTKLTADGVTVWTRTWGSAPTSMRDDESYAVATTPDGSILVAGTFATTVDFDPGPGVDAHDPAGSDFSAYVTELDGAGNHVWTRTWGSGLRTSAWGVSTGPDGSIYVAGAFDGVVDLDPSAGTDAHASNGALDAYVSKLDATGTFVWGRTWGGSGDEENAGRLGVDGAGNVTVAGSSQTSSWDLYVRQLTPDGATAWAIALDPTTGTELPIGLAVAPDGSIAVAGIFYGTVKFDANDVHTSGAQYDAFVMRLHADGTRAWTAAFGGAVFDARTAPYAVAIDGAGRVVVGGLFYKTVDFDPGPGVVSRTAVGNDDMTDMYAMRLKSDGTFDTVQTWGGTGFDVVLGVATGADASIFAVGFFEDTVDFSTTAPPDVRTAKGPTDAFALRWIP